MPRQPLGVHSRTRTATARHRWAARLGPAAADEAPERKLLEARPLADGLAGEVLPKNGLPGEGPPAEARAPAPVAFRWRTGRRAAVLLAVVSALLGGWFWWQTVDGAPREQSLDGPPGAKPASAAASTGSSSQRAHGGTAEGPARGTADPAEAGMPDAAAGTIIVHVAGAVASPGVVELPAGSRLHQALQAAGGSTEAADLDRLNLASVLGDGQKILVPQRGSPVAADPAGPTESSDGTGLLESGAPGAGGTGPGSTAPPGGKINLNTAGAEELATLPRVGPVLAQRIVDWRRQHGRFGSVQELDAVEGVGPKLLEALLPLVRV